MVPLQGGSDGVPGATPPRALVSGDPELTSRYRAYRARQAQGLLSLVPREAIRPLYGRAREWARKEGLRVGKDPLATLLLYLQEILPLPPFDVWTRDRERNLAAHVREEFSSAPAHRRASPPVTVESRSVRLGQERWQATLNLFRRDEVWRGFISFQPADQGPVLRTGDIFREEDPQEIRSRFLSFHSDTLLAFLRSVLS